MQLTKNDIWLNNIFHPCKTSSRNSLAYYLYIIDLKALINLGSYKRVLANS